jgi:hypothetical protein
MAGDMLPLPSPERTTSLRQLFVTFRRRLNDLRDGGSALMSSQ